jgi:hypothetical protein
MKIVFAGSIGRFPVGGHAWVDLQYLYGLQQLGHELTYLEECGQGSWVYQWETEQLTTDLEYPTAYLRSCLAGSGLEGRWIYRAGDRSVGMSVEALRAACADADLMIVRGSPIELWRREYLWPRRRAYIDSDPGFTQIRIANGDPFLGETVERCEALFTIGQRMGSADCLIPDCGRSWNKFVAPISLDHWPLEQEADAEHFTSVMQWQSYKDVVYRGVRYGNKNREFERFIGLPGLTSQTFMIAMSGGDHAQLSRYGWRVSPGWKVSLTPQSYRQFVQASRVEFAVAKHGYVATRGGWFSDRSICYLASGRPVLVQDTGLGDWLPLGEGLVVFEGVADALRGIERINADYSRQRAGARALAEQYFAAERVLPPFLDKAVA